MLMAANSNSVLEYKHIHEGASSILEYIDKRRRGEFKVLHTRWAKFNNLIEGGFSPNSTVIIAGGSGSGKSAVLAQIETDMVEYNKDIKPYILSFTLEMSASRIVGRKLSNRLNKSVQELYSGFAFTNENTVLSEEDYKKVLVECDELVQYPVYYVETPGSVTEIKNTIHKFREEVSKDSWLVITLDHTLLVKGRATDSERDIITELQHMFLQEKKIGLTTIIQLSQLNRDIESYERVTNPNLHFPTRRDLSTSDAVYQASDVVIVISRPEYLGIKRYGPNGWDVDGILYLHCIKNRDGELKILKFKNELKFNKIVEFNT